jgi:cyclin B
MIGMEDRMDICVEEEEQRLDPQDVRDYQDEIFYHLKMTNADYQIDPNYMRTQKDINEKMRGILIDWLVDVHNKFKLLPETLFLTVHLIDRYLEKVQIMRTMLQLVGVSAMLIACKYEEIYAPEIKDFVYITDKAYSKDDVKEMERNILSALDYNVTVVSPFRLLEIFQRYLNLDDNSFYLCRYFFELFFLELKMYKFSPLLLVASSLYIIFKLGGKNDIATVCDLSGISETELRECAKDICSVIDNAEKSSLKAVRKKFSTTKFNEVSKIKFN